MSGDDPTHKSERPPLKQGVISLEPGQRIRNTYEVVRLVGQGGFGKVYLAVDVDDGQEYALKLTLTDPDSLSDAEMAEYIKRARREAGLSVDASHDNVLQLHEFIVIRSPSNKPVPVMVFPFIRGLNLAQHIRENKPSLRVILRELVRALASALAELHRRKIFHRDIKPNNIIVRESDGHVFLIDLGIATSHSSKTQTAIGTLLGTEAFLAPEYLAYFLQPDGRRFIANALGDIYSLGITLYEVLGGLNPLRPLTQQYRSNVLAYADARQTYQVTPLQVLNPALPSAVSELVMKCMALDPAARFANGADLMLTVDELLQSTAADARYDAPYEPPSSQVAAKLLAEAGPALTSAQRPSAAGKRHGSMPLPIVSAVDKSINLDVADLDDDAPAGAPSRSSNTAGGGFKPPTRQSPAAFHAPADEAPASVEKHEEGASLPTAIRRAKQQLEAPDVARARSRRLVFAGVAALILVVLVLAVVSAPRPATEQTSGRSLLLQDDGGVAEGALTTPRAAPVMISAPVAPPPAPVFDAGAPEPLLAAVEPPRKTGSARRQNADAKAVDDILAREYGGRRPVVGGVGAELEDKLTPEQEMYYRFHPLAKRPGKGQTVDAGLPALGVTLGSEISAVLVKPLNSTTAGFGPAVVQVVQPFRVKGETVIPTRTLGYGTAQPSRGGRFTVHFTRLKFPDGREYAIDAIAYDAIDGQPGLRALKSTYVVQGGASTAELVARGVATTALGKVPGGDVSDVAKNAGGTVINGSGQQPSGPYQVEELRLEPNYELNIFVSSPF